MYYFILKEKYILFKKKIKQKHIIHILSVFEL